MNIRYECVKDGNPHPVTCALVVHEAKVLMIMRGPGSYEGYWALPGGMIEKGETPEEAVLRELFEEAGVRGHSPKILTAHLIRGDVGLPHTSIDIAYRVTVESIPEDFGKGDVDGEVVRTAFFSIDDLPEKIAFGHRNIINTFATL